MYEFLSKGSRTATDCGANVSPPASVWGIGPSQNARPNSEGAERGVAQCLRIMSDKAKQSSIGEMACLKSSCKGMHRKGGLTTHSDLEAAACRCFEDHELLHVYIDPMRIVHGLQRASRSRQVGWIPDSLRLQRFAWQGDQ